jgi:TolB-like protein/DNA-binding SARP family transcriptional activator/Flp pilus assembly protein TadD
MYTLRLFGGVSLEGPSGQLSGPIVQRRRLALLAMLAAGRGTGWSRDKLMAYLWAEHDEAAARHRLTDSVYVLRKALGENAVLAAGEYLRLDAGVVWTDIAAFEAALEEGDLERAVDLFAGPFMDGFYLSGAGEFERWIETEQRRLANQYERALESLAEAAEEGDDLAKAVDWWRRLVAHDPCNSRIVLRLMKALARIGDPANAIHQAREHERMLHEQLGVEAPSALRVFVEQLVREPLAPTPEAELAEAGATEAAELSGAPEMDRPERGWRSAVASSVVVLAYVVAAWAALQALARLGDEFALPDWLLPIALVLLLVGLPVVMVTPHLKDDWRPKLLTWRTAGLGFVGALTLWGVVAAGLLLFRGYARPPGDERPSIAVLPFNNLSPDPENEYFTDGIHDQILTHLYKIGGLSVRGRASVMPYRDSTKSSRQIGDELNVRYFLEGGVLRGPETVRLSVQLIDAWNDEHVWAETYDRELTVENLLSVQSEIALRMAETVKASLTADEAGRIVQVPTENLEAYDYYLRGESYRHRGPVEEDLRLAIDMYKEAIRLDTTFALAYAMRSLATHTLWAWFERGNARLRTEASEAAFRARHVSADLPEGHLAVAYHYARLGDCVRQREHILAAVAEMPNNSEVLVALGDAERCLGNWEEDLALRKQAAELDPRNAWAVMELATSNAWMHRYAEAERCWNRAIALTPYVQYYYIMKARLYISWQGDVDKAWEVLSTAPTGVTITSVLLRDVSGAWWLYRLLLDKSPVNVDRLSIVAFGEDTATYLLARAEALRLTDERERMRAYYDSARVALESRITAAPDDPRLHGELGIALAALGHGQEAVSHAASAVRLLPVTQHAMDGYDWPAYLAHVYLELGEYDAAMDQLEILLSNPGWVTVAWLGADPLWDPLHDHPRFQALLEQYE